MSELPAEPQGSPPQSRGEESATTVETGEVPEKERWFVPFVVIPLGLAAAIVGIVALANFLLGKSGPRTLDELLIEIQSGGSNSRKQAAFALARNLAEEVQKGNDRFLASGGDPGAAHATVLPRRELAKIERAFELTKGDDETRQFLVQALGLVGDDDTAEFLGNQLIAPDEPDPDNQRRVQLLLALARIASDRSIPMLDETLVRVKSREEADDGVANALAAAYGNLRGAAGTRGLLEILGVVQGRGGAGASVPATGAAGRWKFVCWTVAVNLAKRNAKDPEAAAKGEAALIEAIADIAADPLRPEGERVFKNVGSNAFLGSPHPDNNREKTAAQVIEALLVLQSKGAIPNLKKIAESDPNLRIRSMALDALKRLEGGPR